MESMQCLVNSQLRIYWRSLQMSSLNANNPYGQTILPYQPSIERTNPIQSQQKKAASPPRMSKAEALTIVRRCKKWLIAGSLVAFGIVSALVTGHVVGTTSVQATPASNNQITPTSNAPATSSSDGSFFQQPQQLQGGEYGGYSFGNSNSWQPPVSRSRVS